MVSFPSTRRPPRVPATVACVSRAWLSFGGVEAEGRGVPVPLVAEASADEALQGAGRGPCSGPDRAHAPVWWSASLYRRPLPPG